MEKDLKKKCQELPCPEADDYESSTSGVLLSNEIEHYATKYQMIKPFDPKNLRPAGYRLNLGEKCSIGGKRKKLYPKPGKDELIIPPFEVAIISTQETINLPRFIIARWNLRVSLVYEGLLWTGALQVDPGWCGPLHCPIYNLSDEEVALKLGKPVVLMDFVKTTPFKKGNIEYPRPPRHQTLTDYHWRLKSALFTEAATRIDKIESRLNRVDSLIGIMFAVIAVLFAALSIFVASGSVSQPEDLPKWVLLWISISIALSIIAVALAVFLRVKLVIKKRWKKIIMSGFYIAYVVASAIALAALIKSIF